MVTVSAATDRELVAQALAHPVRIAWIECLHGEPPISASRFRRTAAERSGGQPTDLGDAAYHARALLRTGVVRRVARRGHERFYALSFPTAEPVVDVVEALKGRRRVVHANGEATMPCFTDAELVGVAGVFGHPVRLAIARVMCRCQGTRSPASVARETGGDLRTVAHHFRLLEQLGFVSLETVEEGPTSLKHFYGLRGPVALAVGVTVDLLEGRTDFGSAGAATQDPLSTIEGRDGRIRHERSPPLT